MAQQVADRAEAQNGPPVTVLAYPDAGHLSVGFPVDPSSEFYDQLGSLGGSSAGNAAAREASWQETLTYLDQQLRQ